MRSLSIFKATIWKSKPCVILWLCSCAGWKRLPAVFIPTIKRHLALIQTCLLALLLKVAKNLLYNFEVSTSHAESAVLEVKCACAESRSTSCHEIFHRCGNICRLAVVAFDEPAFCFYQKHKDTIKVISTWGKFCFNKLDRRTSTTWGTFKFWNQQILLPALEVIPRKRICHKRLFCSNVWGIMLLCALCH